MTVKLSRPLKHYRLKHNIPLDRPIKEKTAIWDARIPEIKEMAIQGVTLASMAIHYSCSIKAVIGALNKRDIRVLTIRYHHRKQNERT
jgi:hypothetical protein